MVCAWDSLIGIQLTIISSIFQIANTKPQISTSNNQIREYRRETKQTITPLKLPIAKNNLIYLPTIETETLVRVWFLLRKRYLWFRWEEGCWCEIVLPIQEQRKSKKKEQKMKNRETQEWIWCNNKEKIREKVLGGARVLLREKWVDDSPLQLLTFTYYPSIILYSR